MSKRLLPILSIVLCLAAFSSCKKESDTSYGADVTRGYYPLSRGHYVIYDVDSTIWGEIPGGKRLAHYQMRYTVADTFKDLQNRPSYRVDAIIRNADTAQWRTSDVFYVTPTLASIEVVQNNLRFTKMVFPVADGVTWKGNNAIATADQDLSFFYDWDYRYSGKGSSYDDGRASFDNTVTVQERDETKGNPDSSAISYAYRNFSKAVYAYNVGLVYREFVHWVYDPVPGAINGRKGYEVVMRATDHN